MGAWHVAGSTAQYHNRLHFGQLAVEITVSLAPTPSQPYPANGCLQPPSIMLVASKNHRAVDYLVSFGIVLWRHAAHFGRLSPSGHMANFGRLSPSGLRVAAEEMVTTGLQK